MKILIGWYLAVAIFPGGCLEHAGELRGDESARELGENQEHHAARAGDPDDGLGEVEPTDSRSEPPQVADLWSLAEVISTLEREPDVTIGALDEPACKVFGNVTDVSLDQEGRLFVLDAPDRSVKAFDRSGACLFSVGRHGSGPGELERPVAVAVSDESVLNVLDAGNGRIEKYNVSGDRGDPLGAVPLREFRGSDFCFLDDRMFVAASQVERAIHEVDGDGQSVSAFGSLHSSTESVMGLLASPELILCHQDSESLLVAALHMPTVHVYTLQGEQVFSTELPDFSQAELLTDGGAVSGYRPSPEGIDEPVAGVELEENLVLLQSGTPVGQAGMFRGPRAAVLDIGTEQIEAMPDEMPHVFAAKGALLVAADHGEVPRLGIWMRREER